MAVRDIPRLLEKLNKYCENAFATAVGMCVSRGHYEVRHEHLLIEFLDRNDGDIPLILHHFGIDAAHLKKEVTHELENLRAGNTGKPLFSPPLLDELELAWVIASLNLGLPAITSGSLFIAALERGQLGMSSYGDMLRGINLETLKDQYFKIVQTSIEQTGKQTTAAASAQGTGAGQADVLTQFCTNFTSSRATAKSTRF